VYFESCKKITKDEENAEVVELTTKTKKSAPDVLRDRNLPHLKRRYLCLKPRVVMIRKIPALDSI